MNSSTMASSFGGNIQWNETADKKLRDEWEQKLRASLANQQQRSQVFTPKQIKSVETYNYKQHPDSTGRSLIGWAVKHDASVVLSVKEDTALLSERTLIGWALRTDQTIPDSNIELFVTEEKDILKLKVNEVSEFAKRVVKSPILQDCVNQTSIRRPVVGMLFADFYANCILIAVFINATNAYLLTGQANNDVMALYVLAVYFFLREMLQAISQKLEYLVDPWNILDIARVALTLTSAYFLKTGSGTQEQIDRILITSAVFIFGGVISFLRSAFLPFSKFVSGIRKIVIALLPFFVITFVVLLGFGYMYWVRNFVCPGRCDLIDGFYSAYAFFVGGPEEVANPLDIFAGLVLVVILLNVVIAIVTQAWDDTSRSEKSFWHHRISFLIELRLFLKWVDREGDNGNKKPNSIDYIGRDLDSRLDTLLNKWQQKLSFMVRVKSAVDILCYGLFYCFLVLLGLVTFGFYWPMRARMVVFGSNRTRAICLLEDKIENLKLEVQQSRSDIQDIKQGINEIRGLLYQIPGVVPPVQNRSLESSSNVMHESWATSPRKPSSGVLVQPKSSKVSTTSSF